MAKKSLIKKGTPFPGKPDYKYDSSHLNKSDADKRQNRLLSDGKAEGGIIVRVPRQHALYQKPMRITPKRPKLRR